MHFKLSKDSPLIFGSLLLLLIFCWIEVDLYAPAFPQLRRSFGTTEEMIQAPSPCPDTSTGIRSGRWGC
jgi:hypothetical protein